MTEPAPPTDTVDEPAKLAVFKPFFAPERRRLIAVAGSAFIAGLCEAALLVLLAQLAFSIGGQSNAVGKIPLLSSLHLSINAMFVIGFVLALLRYVFQVWATHLTARATTSMTERVRASLFDDYVHASWETQASQQEADVQDLLVRHVNRVTSAAGLTAQAISVAFSLLALVGSAILADPLSALVILATGIILFVMMRPLTQRAKRVAVQQIETGRLYGARSLEAIGVSLEIRAFGVSDEVSGILADATKRDMVPVHRSTMLKGHVTALYQLTALAIMLGGLLVVHTLVDRPLASLGAIIVILVRALNQSGTLQIAYHALDESTPFAQRLVAEQARLRDSVPAPGNARLSPGSALEFQHISYQYTKGTDALTDVSFTVEPGEAIGIIGPSGSGKSTIIQLLLRLRRPTSGQYLIGGTSTDEFDEASWFGHIAFVPQDCRLIAGSISDNIRFFRTDLSDDEVVRAAVRAHVYDEIMAMPDGFNTDLGTRAGSLSGGQRQRVAIARALARRPSIMVLDEPTSALDMRSESLVHETFTELKGEVTMFLIAHRLSTLNTCDRIMVMGDGRLQAFGTRAELEASSEFYRDAIRLSRIRS